MTETKYDDIRLIQKKYIIGKAKKKSDLFFEGKKIPETLEKCSEAVFMYGLKLTQKNLTIL